MRRGLFLHFNMFAVLPIIFAILLLSVGLSNASESEATLEVCVASSKYIVATDGGVVDLSNTGVASVYAAGSTTESVIEELKSVCGFTSFVLSDGSSTSAEIETASIDLRDLNTLSDLLLESCNYDAVIVEVPQEDICAEIKCAQDQKSSPWLEGKSSPWLEWRSSPWLENRGQPWIDHENRGQPWVDHENRAQPWVDLENRGQPWVDLKDLCTDDEGQLSDDVGDNAMSNRRKKWHMDFPF